MWEITLVFNVCDKDSIKEFEKHILSSYPDINIFISHIERLDEYILSVAVDNKYKDIISLLRLELSKLIIRVCKFEFFINGLKKLIPAYTEREFVSSVMVSIGSEMDVLGALYKLSYKHIVVRSYVYFILKDMVESWSRLIDNMTVEFAGEKPNTIVIEFLKYIVGITYDDALDIDIYVDCKNYLIDFGVDDKILVPINDRTGLIINLLNLRPSSLILHNYSAFPKDVYSLLKYVFGAKFRVEV